MTVRPTFNVTDFQNTISIQMNEPMRRLLIEFIGEVDDQELEIELRAFRNALSEPKGAQFKRHKTKKNGRRRPQRV